MFAVMFSRISWSKYRRGAYRGTRGMNMCLCVCICMCVNVYVYVSLNAIHGTQSVTANTAFSAHATQDANIRLKSWRSTSAGVPNAIGNTYRIYAAFDSREPSAEEEKSPRYY